MKIFRKATGFHFALHPQIRGAMRMSLRARLTHIIRHANASVPFYKGKFDAFLDNEPDMSNEDFFYAFGHIPIVEKQDLKTANEGFKSDHLSDMVNLLGTDGQAPDIKTFIKHALIKKDFYATVSTGGSSGAPTFRWMDYHDANLFAQSFLYSFRLNGWKTGEDFVVFYPLKSYFTGAYAAQAEQLRRFFGFTMVAFEDVTQESVETLLCTLKDTKATLLVIFPCVLQRVAEIMHHNSIPPFENLPCINVSGEFFMDCSKKFIQTMFPDSDIQSTYGAVEFGEIAHQSGLSPIDYDVFDDYVYLEQGPQNSILVTTFHQKSFPLIRYRIEDMGQILTDENGKQRIKSLEGKNTDYIVGTDGYMYFASFFNSFVNELNKALDDPIIHFMLRHETKEGNSTLALNFVLKTPNKDIEKNIKQASKEALGDVFSNFNTIDIRFPDHFAHDYTRKFKIIGEGDGLSEVVGGYYQRKAS